MKKGRRRREKKIKTTKISKNKATFFAFYIEKELSKKEYFRRFIEEPFNKDIYDSYVKILDYGVIFVDEIDKRIKIFY